MRTHVKLDRRHAVVYTRDDLLRDPATSLEEAKYNMLAYIRDRIDVFGVETIAKLLDTRSDLFCSRRQLKLTREARRRVPCQIGRVPCD